MIPAAVGVVACIVMAVALVRKPSRALFLFLCFYLISVFDLAGVFITFLLMRGGGGMSVQDFWLAGSTIGRFRFLFLVLFSHSVYRFRATLPLGVVMTALVGFGVASPFLFYSIVPALVEIIIVLYSFSYLSAVFLLRKDLSLSSRHQGLLRAVLACSVFFLIGLILDILESIPQASVYVSIVGVDFNPVYLFGIGVIVTIWAVRDLANPDDTEEQASSIHTESHAPDLSRLPVTKREREIVILILRGETNASIAERLFISESTVKKHINNLFRKLGITSRWELLKLSGDSSDEV